MLIWYKLLLFEYLELAVLTLKVWQFLKRLKSDTVSTVSPSISHEVMGPGAMILVFWMLSFKPMSSDWYDLLEENNQSILSIV